MSGDRPQDESSQQGWERAAVWWQVAGGWAVWNLVSLAPGGPGREEAVQVQWRVSGGQVNTKGILNVIRFVTREISVQIKLVLQKNHEFPKYSLFVITIGKCCKSVASQNISYSSKRDWTLSYSVFFLSEWEIFAWKKVLSIKRLTVHVLFHLEQKVREIDLMPIELIRLDWIWSEMCNSNNEQTTQRPNVLFDKKKWYCIFYL